MKKYKAIVFLFFVLITIGQNTLFSQINVIPLPSETNVSKGFFSFTSSTRLFYDEGVEIGSIRPLLDPLMRSVHLDLKKVKSRPNSQYISFEWDRSLPHEGYRIDVSPSRISVKSSSNSGFFYASTTLSQLLPIEFHRGMPIALSQDIVCTIPCVAIGDAPRYGYRGFMLDVSRYFVPKKEILRLLDLMAFHKLNVFHWHLVDDNGWRLAIKKYPKLTSVGAFRSDRSNLFSMRRNPERGEPTPHGGYYSHEDVKEIVRYAADRHIEVIPEIEMPAHTNSSLAAYPELACPHIQSSIEGVLSGIGGKSASVIYCAGSDRVFDFLQDVIDEVIELFPSNTIHIGGDEAAKENWKECPLCQKRMKDNSLPNEEELQSYFIRRMNDYIISKGKRLAGWDELADSELPKGAIVYAWRGMGQYGLKAAEQGHGIVLTPARKLYLIRYQGAQWFEPFTYFGNNTLKDVFLYDSSQSGFSSVELNSRVKGVQASMWCEFIASPEELEYMVFPRLAAFSEAAWCSPSRSWDGFLNRLDYTLKVYDYRSVTYSNAMYNLSHQVTPQNGSLQVEFSCMRPDLAIRYTTDLTFPDLESTLYKGAFQTTGKKPIIAQAFRNGQSVGTPLHLNFIDHYALGCYAESEGKEIKVLTNGLLGSERFSDGEYVDCFDRDFEVTLHLSSIQTVTSIYIGSLIHAGMGVYPPRKVSISTSIDGVSYVQVFSEFYDRDRVFINAFSKNSFTFGLEPHKAQFIRIQMERPGIVPSGVPREGEKSRMVFDEVRVN